MIPCAIIVLLVLKKDGIWRLCVDFRAISMPDDMLNKLHGTFIFSKIDIKSGYNRIRMKEAD